MFNLKDIIIDEVETVDITDGYGNKIMTLSNTKSSSKKQRTSAKKIEIPQHCNCCGAPIDLHAKHCPYCGVIYQHILDKLLSPEDQKNF